MKNLLLAIVMATGTSACLPQPVYADWYLETGAHENLDVFDCSHCWEDSGSKGAYFGLRYEEPLTDNIEWFVYAAHYSNWTAGWPFNDDLESTHDVIGVGLRLNLSEFF